MEHGKGSCNKCTDTIASHVIHQGSHRMCTDKNEEIVERMDLFSGGVSSLLGLPALLLR